MRSPGRAIATATVVAALVTGGVLLTLPAPSAILDLPAERADSDTRPVAGAFHLHTDRSDGRATSTEIAEAAAQAGLQFVVLTDHGDATRRSDPPRYHSGVLILDAVEISTSGGHYVAVGVARAPYPLGGSAASVVEDVRRLGGFGVIAHPTSPKDGLAWLDLTLEADGIEWLNGDSSWRDESVPRLLLTVGHYLFRPREALATLLDRPTDALATWDRAAATRAVVGLAGADAHTLAGNDALLGMFSLRVEPTRAWTGDAEHDADALMSALRAGRVYTAVDAVASPPRLTFEGRLGPRTIRMGERVVSPTGLELRALAIAPAGSQLTLMANGKPVLTVSEPELRYVVPAQPAAYRVEVQAPAAPGSPAIPWIVSNPIYVGPAPSTARRAAPTPTAVYPLGREDGSLWAAEHHADSSATVTETAGRVTFDYHLADTDSSQFVAAVRQVTPGLLSGYDGVAFNVEVSRPARVFLQLRSGTAPRMPRWQGSFYADTTRRRIVIPFSDLESVHSSFPPVVDVAASNAILLVVDRTHARPGDEATIVIDSPQLERWR